MSSFFNRLKNFLLSLNLYDNQSKDEKTLFYQRFSTRLYLLTFIILSIILLIYISLEKQTTLKTINSPSESMINSLYMNHETTLNCPCTQIAIEYSHLINHNIIYHHICSSQFMEDEWIEKSYKANVTYIWPIDIRTIASAFLQNLRSFCSLSNMTMVNTLFSFASQSIITKKVLSSKQFHNQAQNSIQFIRNTAWKDLYYPHLITREIINANQLISGLGTNLLWRFHPTSIVSQIFVNPIEYDARACHISPDSTTSAGLFLDVKYSTQYTFSKETYNGSIPARMIPGWKGGCLPLESLLHSTLECFYNLSCLSILTEKNHKMIQTLDSNREKYPISTNVLTLLGNLFINEWNWTISYKNYTKKCAPLFCTYSYTHRNSFIQIVITLFGLAGGLSTGLNLFIEQIILRLLIWNMKRKLKRQIALNITDGSNVSRDQLTMKQRSIKVIRQMKSKVVELNLFEKTVWIGKENVKRQRWTTRIFLICLATAFIIRTIYIVIERKTTVISITLPNQSQYESLLKTYPDSLECPCTNISINYGKLFTINPIYHQICSSLLTHRRWYSRLRVVDDILASDFRVSAGTLFRLLGILCETTRETIESSIDRFLNIPFVNYHIIESKLFNERANAISQNFIKITKREFIDILQLVRSLTSASQFILFANQNAVGRVDQNQTVFYTHTPFNGDLSGCYCARDLHCEKDSYIYHFNSSTGENLNSFKIKGFILTCFPLDSLLKSSPECLYNLTCMDNFLSFFEDKFIPRITLDSTQRTRFHINKTFQLIINELFVEDWRIRFSYSSFFNQCMPSHCSYSITKRNGLLFIITTLIALYGGLTVVLKLILPHLINLITLCMIKFKKRSTENHNQRQPIRALTARTKRKLIELNIFESNVKEINVVEKQRISTRIYILLVIIILIGFGFYTSLSKHSYIATVNEPGEEVFNDLYKSYSDTIQCPVSDISIEYSKFLSINYSIHEICRSDFLKKEIMDSFFHLLVSPLPTDDFRTQSISYFHLISSLCSLTETLLQNSLNEFSQTSLINNRILSPKEFHSQMEYLFFSLNETLTKNLIKSLKLFEDNIQGNQFATYSGSNWKLLLRYNRMGDLIRSVPVERSNCSCAISNSCFEKAKLYLNENETYIIEGFQLGCTPLYSVLSSTLQCFYNIRCLKYLMKVFPIPVTLSTLSLNKTRFHLNTTMRTIVENFFIEEWNFSTNYSSFYIQSHPKQCFYSHTKRKDLLDVFLETLSFYGGLTVVCRFIIPFLLKLFFKIKQRLQN